MPQSRRRSPRRSTRIDGNIIFSDEDWTVLCGELKPTVNSPSVDDHLFKYVAEKLPWDSLSKVFGYLKRLNAKRRGVYLAHDSFGVARYGGRGNIFSRLKSHKRKYRKELVYYSFFIIENATHEREIENVILRAAGPQLILNQLKVRDGIDPGRVGDYEPGTKFFRRKYARGSKRAVRMKRTRG